ncbi:MAG TPA: GTPase, partial [Acidimicrobiia bacterium]|nr:GTPase [Acidimicrobiia bacterium]
EEKLEALIAEHKVHECVFSYSDVSYAHVMGVSAKVMAAGSSFTLLGPTDTQIPSVKPVVAVCAIRTGAGKSQTSRRVVEVLMGLGLRVVAIRHPMPYGNLLAQKVQRFAEIADLEKHDCTIEEMEEYEPHIVRGNVIYSGDDYEAILRAAENDPAGCDVIVWDGGNNDFAFIKPDLQVTVVDPHRPGHELGYFPGEVNFRRADVIVINKMDSATKEGIATVKANIAKVNPKAVVVEANSPPVLADPSVVKGKRVLVIEDGPTLTHGEMKIGAGTVAAEANGAKELVDPRPFLVGSLVDTFKTYPDIGILLPAMGYGADQMKDLAATINASDADAVVIGTPIDLGRILDIDKPHTRVTYDLAEIGSPNLTEVLSKFVEQARS